MSATESAACPLPRVLVIHEDLALRHELGNQLEGAGCLVYPATHQADGLPEMFRVHPDLILLHVAGDDDGNWTTFARIRLVTDAPVIFLADHPCDRKRHSLSRAHAAILIPPFSVARLKRTIRTLHVNGLAARLAHAPPQQIRRMPQYAIPTALLQAVDRALDEVSPDGEVHLIVRDGRLCELRKLQHHGLTRKSLAGQGSVA